MKQFLELFSSQLIQLGARFGGFYLISVNLKASELGAYAFAISLAAFLINAASFGGYHLVLDKIGKSPLLASGIVRSELRFFWIASTFTSLAVFGIGFSVTTDPLFLYIAIFCAADIFQSGSLLLALAYLSSTQEFRSLRNLRVAHAAVFVMGALGVHVIHGDLTAWVVIFAAVCVMNCWLSVRLMATPKADLGAIHETIMARLKSGAWFFLTSTIRASLPFADKLAFSLTGNFAALGAYAACERIMMALLMPQTAINNIFEPRFFRETERAASLRLLRKQIAICISYTATGAVLYLIAHEVILSHITGIWKEYLPTLNIMLPLLLTQSLYVPSLSFLNSTKDDVYRIAVLTISAISFLVVLLICLKLGVKITQAVVSGLATSHILVFSLTLAKQSFKRALT